LNILEVGVIGNGIELLRVSSLSDEDTLKTDLRAALLHSILLYTQAYSGMDITHFSMKNTLVFISQNPIQDGDLLFYVVFKTGRTGLRELLTDKNAGIVADLKPKFSNLKNKYLQLLGGSFPPDLNSYIILRPIILNIFKLNKDKRFLKK
jgi:hypothetical protein